MKLEWTDETFNPPAQHGSMVDGVQVIITVYEINGERETMMECLCPACHAAAQVGTPDDLEVGIHYLAHRLVKYPGGPWGATEYDGEWFYPAREAGREEA
jgi:hypothetical protein